jgi:hypothetical protein
LIRHIVAFRLSAQDPAERDAAEHGIRERLTALVGVIPGLRSISFGRDLGLVEGHWDVVLVSEHDDNAALEGYQAHEAHRVASAWIAQQVSDRATVDYEL